MHWQNFRGYRGGMTLFPLEDNLCEKASQRREKERKGRGLRTQLSGSVLAEYVPGPVPVLKKNVCGRRKNWE